MLKLDGIMVDVEDGVVFIFCCWFVDLLDNINLIKEELFDDMVCEFLCINDDYFICLYWYGYVVGIVGKMFVNFDMFIYYDM